MGTDERARRSAGDARLGDGHGARVRVRAQAAVRAGADDVEDRAFAGEVRAVGWGTGVGRRGGRVGGDFGGEMGSGVVPGACVPAPAQEGGEEGEDQGLQRGAQALGSAWGAAAGWAPGLGEAICIHLGNISYFVHRSQGFCA